MLFGLKISIETTIRRVIDLFQGDYLPSSTELKSWSADVCEYVRESDKLYLHKGVLYRKSVLNNQNAEQLVLPVHYRDIVYKHLYRTLHLIREKFYWPGLEHDIGERIKNCERCVQFKTPEKNFIKTC